MAFSDWLKKIWGDSSESSGSSSADTEHTSTQPENGEPALVDPPEDAWWLNVEVRSESNLQASELTSIDIDNVCDEINSRIESGDFSLIEIPENIMRILKILREPDFDYNEVADIVSQSPVLMGELIQIGNSALYQRANNITQLNLLLPRLGSKVITSILYMHSLEWGIARNSPFSTLASKVVQHSRAVGFIASVLARRNDSETDGAFCAGLMHDIGKLALLNELGRYEELMRVREQAETEDFFGIIFTNLHERIGARLAQHWHLSSEIQTVITNHHSLEEMQRGSEDAMEQLTATISLADTMARILGYGRSISVKDLLELPACSVLGFHRTENTYRFLETIPEVVRESMKDP